MSTPRKRADALTPAMHRFLNTIVADGLVREKNAPPGFFQMPEGNAGVRIANAAWRLRVLVIVGGYVGGIDKALARELLRKHDLGTLPEGVYVHQDGRVTDKTALIGKVRRTGASRGEACRWYVEEPEGVDGMYDDTAGAGRAICRKLGYTPTPEAA